MTTEFDTRMMARAQQLALRGQFWASPNPHVGCVLVRDGTVIGEGFTQPAGGNHAEVQALEQARQQAGGARGATAYVTLEPCSHQGKTGPCSQALLQAGVTRVVAALEDPNPQVAGRGLAALRAGGVEVACGLLASATERALAGFILRMRRGRGRMRAKLAMSLDGRTAMASGESQWITGPPARQDVQRLRARSCAIVTGVGTVLADDCALTVRTEQLGLAGAALQRASYRQPLRVVLDSQLRTPPAARVLAGSAATLVCHRAEVAVPAHFQRTTTEMLALPAAGGELALDSVVAALAMRQCNEILVESGPRLAGALLQAGLLDELIIYMAPTLMGSLARPLLELPLGAMADRIGLELTDVRRVGEDWRLTARPQYRGAAAD